ncbi:MAG: hypothetical protein OEX19_04700 [Gammaproteobacteria bacterium]|nr:hypothetical protein [Gammaproteobacteria bacterium]
MSDEGFEVPKWDVALESLISEESRKLGQGLTLDDFIRLAKEHTIRFDDIIFTLFALCEEGLWQYHDENGALKVITQEEIDGLFVGGRIKEEDMRHLTGAWSQK